MTITAANTHKEIRYGHRDGPGKGREYACRQDLYFHRRGGHFVEMDTNGSVGIITGSIYGTAKDIFGWAIVGKDTVKHSWKAKATTDDGFPSLVFVVRGLEDKFEIPWNATSASLSKSYIGRGCTLSTANEANATASSLQKAYYQGTDASCNLIIEDVDTTNNTVIVRIKPDNLQH